MTSELKRESEKRMDLARKLEHWHDDQVRLSKGAMVVSLRTADAQINALVDALMDSVAHLTAAISLLEKSGREAAMSDKAFYQMLQDYQNSCTRARAVLFAGQQPETDKK